MVLGYRAPGRTLTHRGRQYRVGQIQVEETYCGVTIDATTWTQHEVDEPSCPRCAGAYAKHRAALRPFAPGEPRRYTQSRHPGLHHFQRAYGTGNMLLGYGWRVTGTRTLWNLTRDARAPRERPWQLTVGTIGPERVAYFTTVHDAVEWTLRLVDADSLVPLFRALKAGTWDTHLPDPPLPAPASGTFKETSPA